MTQLTFNKWRTVPLGTIAEFRNGINYNKDNFGTGIKVINVKDFQDRFTVLYDSLDEINPVGIVKDECLLKNGDIVFVRSNGNRELIGRSLFISGIQDRITHSAFSIRLRFITEDALPKFYAYLFRSSIIRKTLSLYGNGTNISNLNQGILSELQVPLPAKSVQQKVVSILSDFDDFIEINNRKIKILEEMAKNLYLEWLVNFKFPSHERVNMIESKLGLIPEGWEVKNIGSLMAHTIGGGWGQESKDDKNNIPAYVIRGTDIPHARHGIVDNCPYRYHTESNIRPRKLQCGDIIMEVSGGSKGQPVGRALFVNQELLNLFDNNVICASFCKLIRIDKQLLFPEIAYLHLFEIYSKGVIDKYQVQSTGITNFKYEFFLENENILVPDRKLQEAFVEHIAPIFTMIQKLGAKNNNLRRTRDLLLPKLISGELDVENLDIDIGGDDI